MSRMRDPRFDSSLPLFMSMIECFQYRSHVDGHVVSPWFGLHPSKHIDLLPEEVQRHDDDCRANRNDSVCMALLHQIRVTLPRRACSFGAF